MAATALYATVVPVPVADRPNSDFASCSNSGSFTFVLTCGGVFNIAVIASTYGTVTLEALGPDNSTSITTGVSWTANAVKTGVYLAPGTYTLVLS
jgi:hypothetical protein